MTVESVAQDYAVLFHNLPCCNNQSEQLDAQSNSWRGVIIWSLYGLCILARAASRFTVPPRPSQAPFPCEVAEKCHSAGMPKSFL